MGMKAGLLPIDKGRDKKKAKQRSSEKIWQAHLVGDELDILYCVSLHLEAD